MLFLFLLGPGWGFVWFFDVAAKLQSGFPSEEGGSARHVVTPTVQTVDDEQSAEEAAEPDAAPGLDEAAPAGSEPDKDEVDEDPEEQALPGSLEQTILSPSDHPTSLLGVYQQLCKMGVKTPGAIRIAKPEVRDMIVSLYQPLVEREPPAPFFPERRVALREPNCMDPTWRHILDGTRLPKPRALVDITTGMGGGPELDLLEMRLWELNASLSHNPKLSASTQDVYVVVESAHGLRGDKKPLHFTSQRHRFKSFLPQIEHILLDNCTKYAKVVAKMRAVTNVKKKTWRSNVFCRIRTASLRIEGADCEAARHSRRCSSHLLGLGRGAISPSRADVPQLQSP